jgi:ABC-2 type transport system permease protein
VSLYHAETRRLVKRRFTRWLVIGSLGILAAVAVGMFVSNQKSGPAQLAEGKAKAEAQYQQDVVFAQQEVARCQAAPGTAEAANYPPDCTQLFTPQPSDYNPESYMDSTFGFKSGFGNMLTTFAAIFALMAFVVGASYVGAEWTSGGMMNLLLWRPQRLRVLGTKLGALLAAMAALSVVTVAVWTGLFVVIAELRGNLEGMTSGAWQSVLLTELRAVVLVLVAAAVGFGLAAIGRHTALALGVAVGAVVVLQFGLFVVLNQAKAAYPEAWLLPIWVLVWLEKKVELTNYNACDFSATQGCQPDTLTLTWPEAGGLFTALFVLVVGAAMWTMRNRDVA